MNADAVAATSEGKRRRATDAAAGARNESSSLDRVSHESILANAPRQTAEKHETRMGSASQYAVCWLARLVDRRLD